MTARFRASAIDGKVDCCFSGDDETVHVCFTIEEGEEALMRLALALTEAARWTPPPSLADVLG